MKNFLNRLAIDLSFLTEEQFNTLVKKLKELEYKVGDKYYSNYNPKKYLVTDWNTEKGKYGVTALNKEQNKNRVFISSSNISYICDLAAMVDDSKSHVGEIVFPTQNSRGAYSSTSEQYFTDKPCRITRVDGTNSPYINTVRLDNNNYNGWHESFFRKATIAEIINIYTNSFIPATQTKKEYKTKEDLIGLQFRLGLQFRHINEQDKDIVYTLEDSKDYRDEIDIVWTNNYGLQQRSSIQIDNAIECLKKEFWIPIKNKESIINNKQVQQNGTTSNKVKYLCTLYKDIYTQKDQSLKLIDLLSQSPEEKDQRAKQLQVQQAQFQLQADRFSTVQSLLKAEEDLSKARITFPYDPSNIIKCKRAVLELKNGLKELQDLEKESF